MPTRRDTSNGCWGLLGGAFWCRCREVDSLETLNRQLLERCQQDLEQRTRGKPASKREMLADDQAAFLPLPKQAFESRRITDGAADSQSLVQFDTNHYSVPVQYAHRKLIVVATVEEVRLVFEDRLVARHRVPGSGADLLRADSLPGLCLNASPEASTSPSRWNSGRCRIASRSCDGVWKRTIRGTARGRTFACCDCWRSSRGHSSRTLW